MTSRLLALTLFILLAGCSPSLKWTEDVMLPDGRVVTLTRYQEFHGPHELGQEDTPSDYWLEFKHPDTGERVRWNGRRELATVALLIDKGAPELLTTPWFGGFYQWNCPDPPYMLYRYEAGKWQQVPLVTLRGQKVRPNMTDSPPDARKDIDAHGGHLDWQLAGHVSDELEPFDYIDFTSLGPQTFGRHCDPPFNMLRVRERKQ